LPKVELHLHLEGSIGPGLLARLSGARQTRSRPARPSDLASLYRFTGFHGFLQAYARVCSFLRAPSDLAAAVRALGRRLWADGVVHAEVFFSPSVHVRNGIPYRDQVEALAAAAEAVERGGGPTLLFVADGVRQWGVDLFRRMVADLARHPSPRVVGIGLGGDETAVPAHRFARAFGEARALGLSAVVHAGEVGGASSVADVLRWLEPRRIAHGIRAVDDGAVLAALRRAAVPLDVCLTSNRRTGAVAPGRAHPLPRLVAAGVRVTLGTDDPALFRVSLSGEYARASALGLDRPSLAATAVQAARSCLMPVDRRRILERRLRRAWVEPQG
jgi:adenosine deaminase